MATPSWIHPTDVLGAIQAGSSMGLQLRHQDFAEQSAADHLRLAQDQMFENRQRSQEALLERRGEAAARLAEASAQMALQAGHYKDAKEIQTAAQALQRSHYDALEKAADRRADSTDELNAIRAERLDKLNAPAPTSLNALPILGPDGQTMGYGLPGRGGAAHVMIPPKQAIAATPTAAATVLRGIDSALKGDITDEERANYGAQKKTIIDYMSGTLGVKKTDPLVPQVESVPGSGLRGFLGMGKPSSTKTNWVAGSGIDTDTADAYRVIASGRKNPDSVRALYKSRTGKDLPWSPPTQ